MESVTKLSKIFQVDSIDVFLIKPAVKNTLTVLKSYKSESGSELKKVYTEVGDSSTQKYWHP